MSYHPYIQKELYEACKKDDINKVRGMFENGSVSIKDADIVCGYEVNDRIMMDEVAHTPMLAACRFGSVRCVRFLVERGASLSAANDHGDRPLHYAYASGVSEIVELLEERGADRRAHGRLDSTLLNYAAFAGTVDVVRRLIDVDGFDVAHRRTDGWSVLHSACIGGHLDMIDFLLDTGEFSPNEAKENNFTLFFAACQEGHMDAAKLLLKRGADPLMTQPDNFNCLHAACQAGSVELVEFLYDEFGDKLSVTRDDGWSWLHAACVSENSDVLKFFFDRGLTLECTMNAKVSCLENAAFMGNCEALRLLLSKGADVRTVDDEGWSALHGAATGGSLECVRVLVEAGADVHAKRDDGWTVLHSAAQRDRPEIIEYLMERGCALEAGDGGWTVLHAAVAEGCYRTATLLMDTYGMSANSAKHNGWTVAHVCTSVNNVYLLEVLRERGADFSATRIHDQWSIVHEAARHSDATCLRYLLRNGVDGRVKTTDGLSPYHLAAILGHTDALRALHEVYGASLVNERMYSSTALLEAINQSETEAAIFMIENGADLNAANDSQEVPLSRAVFLGHYEIVLSLLRNGVSMDSCCLSRFYPPRGRARHIPLYCAAIQMSYYHLTLALLLYGCPVPYGLEERALAANAATEKKYSIHDLLRNAQRPRALVHALKCVHSVLLVVSSWHDFLIAIIAREVWLLECMLLESATQKLAFNGKLPSRKEVIDIASSRKVDWFLEEGVFFKIVSHVAPLYRSRDNDDFDDLFESEAAYFRWCVDKQLLSDVPQPCSVDLEAIGLNI